MPRARLKRFFVPTQIVLVATIFTLGIVELVGRLILGSSGEVINTESRPYEPFFVSGDFYGQVTTEHLLKSRESPEAYGYRDCYGLYFNQAHDGVWNATWRSDFLFAHNLSRYPAKDVDAIAAANPDVVRIFVIGGSLARGSSATSKKTVWHALLEKSLRDEFKREDIYVFNAAMGAFVSTQERLAFDLAVSSRKPDLVIVLDGYNDMQVPMEMGVAPGDPIQIGKRYGQVYGHAWKQLLAESSVVVRYFYKKKVTAYLSEYKNEILGDSEWSANLRRGIVRTYTENVTHLLDRGRQMNAKVLCFFQPWKALSEHRLHGGDQSSELKFQRACYEEIKNGLKAAETAGDFVDLTDIFNTDERLAFYTDVVHVDDRGHEILADNIAKVVTPEVRRVLNERAAKNP